MGASKPRAAASAAAAAINGVNQASTTSFKTTDNRRRRMVDNVGKEFQTVDFNALDISVLRKYARVHKIKTSSRTSKDELVAAVSRHFANQTVKEIDTITCFLYTARYRDSVLRLPLHM